MGDGLTLSRSLPNENNGMPCGLISWKYACLPKIAAQGRLPRLLMLVGALVLVTAMMLPAGPGAVNGQTRGGMGFVESDGFRSSKVVIDPAHHLSTAGGSGGAGRGAPPRFQAATPLAVEASIPCIGGSNLLPNAGFELGADEWFTDESVEPTNAEAQDGSLSMRLGAEDADAYMDRRVSPVESGATYTLSGWGKLSSAGETAEIGVQFYDSDGNRLTTEEPGPLTFTDTTFEEQHLTFTLPEQVVEIYVYVSKVEGAAQFFADTLSLTVCQLQEPPEATPASPPEPVTLATMAPDDAVATPVVISVVATPSDPQSSQPTAATTAPTSNRSGCDPAYPEERTCIPPGPPFDQGCAITAERNFVVLPPDPQGLDRDRDGIGCEPIRRK